MAAVTSTLVALGGVGLSAAQAIKANKDMKAASAASQQAKNQLKQIKETNPFKAVQTPMLGFELAQQQQSQRESQMVEALQGVGAEGVIGGIGQLAQAGNEQDLQLAAQANQTQFQRDMAQAEAESGIEARKAERDWMAGIGEIQEQNMRRAEAAANRNAAIQGAFQSLGTAALGADKMVDLYRNTGDATNVATQATQAGQDALGNPFRRPNPLDQPLTDSTRLNYLFDNPVAGNMRLRNNTNIDYLFNNPFGQRINPVNVSLLNSLK
jgi:hypothetical protein